MNRFTWLLAIHMFCQLQASVDEGRSVALEAAGPWLEKGFSIREDYWNGDLVLNEKLNVKHQLFKGNEYIFWLGIGANEDLVLEVKVFDDRGEELVGEIEKGKFHYTVRINPPKTGVYRISMLVKKPGEESSDENEGSKKDSKKPEEKNSEWQPKYTWALVYGYR